ncbi:hypothetical protein M441DRAFT_282637 [Trichoderma asperellum CBS 433.97]|uniref:Uncharacterized protein n=1 Tax=Trichoderma asperellum (strain ATCC 204424 / CBS 433.97 / NBRC 101777) TaxID=1042311 RepID=A0A2T3YVR2_TRIA4|nr:hypothetical protein M441DRAFT_282637 [Trichoderma asperellum CBS 433.97]PTB36617.1 hypothetical protein M441DRAFT_282637 [Trichoderma asperellum CBS 433.97]
MGLAGQLLMQGSEPAVLLAFWSGGRLAQESWQRCLGGSALYERYIRGLCTMSSSVSCHTAPSPDPREVVVRVGCWRV